MSNIRLAFLELDAPESDLHNHYVARLGERNQVKIGTAEMELPTSSIA